MTLRDLVISEPYPPGYWVGTRPPRFQTQRISPKMKRALRMLTACGGRMICGPYIQTYQALQRRGLVRLVRETSEPHRFVALQK